MAYRRTIGLLIVCITCGWIHAAAMRSDVKMLYRQLDSLIEHRTEMIAAKEARIRLITDGMKDIDLTPEQQSAINNRLYDEYVAFKFDSALHYIIRNVDTQPTVVGSDLRAASLIRLSHILAVSGLFDKAGETMAEIRPNELSDETRVHYYNQKGELNLYRSEMAQYSPFFQQYIDSAQYYRQLVMQIAPKESFDYVFNLATYSCEQGETDKGINLLEGLLPTLQQGDRQYSIVTSTLAFFYVKKKMPEMQERYLLLSAISDVRGAILENNSLRELATVLMQRKEYKKAYDYLSQASIDALDYGSRLRSLQVARLTPLIAQSYDVQRTQTQQRTTLLLGIISVVALLLVGTILYILSLVKKRRVANKKIHRMNEALSRHNANIEALNNQMKESNRIKDEYIGRFLELSSALIHRGEERAKQLNRLARDRKLEELYAELKNQRPINEGIRLFHQNFDTAFLNIYPNFISEVNRLMSDDNQFEVSDDEGRLTTELRVLALIRLGITDNQKIADILRSSITTIYTYRSKIKGRALRRDSFEDDVRRISTY